MRSKSQTREYIDDTSHLQILRQLTDRLLLKHMRTPVGENLEYETEAGTVLAFGVFDDGRINMARGFGSKGTILKWHTHVSPETFGPYTGAIKVIVEDQPPRVLSPGECVTVPAGAPHNIEWLEDAWVWGVTVPPDTGYPVPTSR